MDETLQVAGAIAILAAFAAAQTGRADVQGTGYLALNFAGSFVLAVLALRGGQWGFLLLEGAWAALSAYGLITQIARRRGS